MSCGFRNATGTSGLTLDWLAVTHKKVTACCHFRAASRPYRHLEAVYAHPVNAGINAARELGNVWCPQPTFHNPS
jgi:hypothetical protein